MVPPDPMPNSEVKRRNADGSVGISHVRVGHRQVEIEGSPSRNAWAFCFLDISNVTKRGIGKLKATNLSITPIQMDKTIKPNVVIII